MPFHVIAHLVTHPGREGELAAVFQLRVQLPFQTQQHMPAPAPMIGQVTGRVFDHAHTGGAEVARAPQGIAGDAWVQFRFEGGPVGGGKRDGGQFHGGLGHYLTWLDPIRPPRAAVGTDRRLLWDTGARACYPARPAIMDARLCRSTPLSSFTKPSTGGSIITWRQSCRAT